MMIIYNLHYNFFKQKMIYNTDGECSIKNKNTNADIEKYTMNTIHYAYRYGIIATIKGGHKKIVFAT